MILIFNLNTITKIFIICLPLIIFSFTKGLDLGHDLQKRINLLKCAIGLEKHDICIVDGGWSLWSPWGSCEGECGQVGRRVRHRICNNPLPDKGAYCNGEREQVKQCTLPACSLDEYDKMLVNDTIRYSQFEVLREFNNSFPAIVSKCLAINCAFEPVVNVLSGSSIIFWNALLCVKLNTGCPVLGGWSPWGEWSRCNALCGPGKQFHCRACKSPIPFSSEFDCRGENCTYETCIGTDCYKGTPQGGLWSAWSSWSECSSTCGPGLQRRNRICNAKEKYRRHTEPPLHLTKATKKSLIYPVYNDDDYYDDDLIYSEDYAEDSVAKLVGHKNKLSKYLKKMHKANLVAKERKHDRIIDESGLKTTVSSHKIVLNKTKPKHTHKSEHKIAEKNKLSPTVEPRLNTFSLSDVDAKITPVKSVISTIIYPSVPDESLSDKRNDAITTEQAKVSVNDLITTIFNTINTTEIPSTAINDEKFQSKGVEKVSPAVNTNLIVPQINSKYFVTVPNEFINVHSECGHEDVIGTTCVCIGDRNKMSTTFDLFTNKPIIFPTVQNPVFIETTTNIPPVTLDSISTETSSPITSENTIRVTAEVVLVNTVTSVEISSDMTICSPITTESLTTITVNTPTMPETTQTSTEISLATANITTERTTTSTQTSTVAKPSTRITTVSSTMSAENLSTTSNTTKTSEAISTLGLLDQILTVPGFMRGRTTEGTTVENASLGWFTPVCRTTLAPVTHTPRPSECVDSDVVLQPFRFPSYSDSFVLQDCTGPFEEFRPCQKKPCDVNGEWSSWSASSVCSAECGVGSQVSSRACSNPPPKGNGLICFGSITLKSHCFMKPCPEMKQNVAFFEEKNQLAFPRNEIPTHLLHMFIRFRHYKPTGYLIVRQENICEENCVSVALLLQGGYLVLRANVIDCSATLVSRHMLSVGEWHTALITLVGDMVFLRIDDNILPLTDNLTCTPMNPNYDLPMVVGAGVTGEIDKVIINFVPVALNKKNDYQVPLNIQFPGHFPDDDASVAFKPSEDEEEANLSLEEFIQAPCFGDHKTWNIDIAVKPVETDGLIMLMQGDGIADYLLLSLEQNRVRLRVKIGSTAAESVENIKIEPNSWILLEMDERENASISISVNGGVRHPVVFPEGYDVDQFTIRCMGGILFGEIPTSIKARVLSDHLHYFPSHSVRGFLGMLAIDNELQNMKNLPAKICSDSIEQKSSDSYIFSSRTASKTVRYEEVEVILGDTVPLTCLYNISNPDSEVNLYNKDRDITQVVAMWIKLDQQVEKVFENASGLSYSIFDNGRLTRLTIKSYQSVNVIEGFYSCWVQSQNANITGLNIITYGLSVIDPDLYFNSWHMKFLKLLGYFAILLLLLIIIWLIFDGIVDLKKGSGFFRCKKLSPESEKNAILKLIDSKMGLTLLGSEFIREQARQRYLAQNAADEEQRVQTEDDDDGHVTESENEITPATIEEETDTEKESKDKKNVQTVYQSRISLHTPPHMYPKKKLKNAETKPIKRQNLNEKRTDIRDCVINLKGQKYLVKKKNNMSNNGYSAVNDDFDSEDEYLEKLRSSVQVDDTHCENCDDVALKHRKNNNHKASLRNKFLTKLQIIDEKDNDRLEGIIYTDLTKRHPVSKHKQFQMDDDDPGIGKITETPAYRKIESKMGNIINQQSKYKNKDFHDIGY